MPITRGYWHSDRRTRHTILIMTRGIAEECKRAIRKDQSKNHLNNFIDNQFFQVNKNRKMKQKANIDT